MWEKIWVYVFRIWRGAQKNYFTFHFVLWLKKLGVTDRVKALIRYYRDLSLRKQPDEYMEKNKRFCEDNRERITRMLSLLYDEKSRKVWGGVMRYRMDRIPIEKDCYSEHDQYFVEDIVHIEDGEVFVDGGAYVGDTIQKFIKNAHRDKVKIKRIVAFEPNEENYRMLEKNYGARKQIKLINKGLSDKEEVLQFCEDGNASRITDNSEEVTTEVAVINLDAVPECKDATWIKMDIEGAELNALQGAREIILRNRPKLTICIYHGIEHMVCIAEYIHELVPEYRLYVRHHSRGSNETVLYAVK